MQTFDVMHVAWNGRVAVQQQKLRTVLAGTFLVVDSITPCSVRTLFNQIDILPVRWDALLIRFSVLSDTQDVIYETFEVPERTVQFACKCIEQVSKVHAQRLPELRRSLACIRIQWAVDIRMLQKHCENEGGCCIPTTRGGELSVYVDIQDFLLPQLSCILQCISGPVFKSPKS